MQSVCEQVKRTILGEKRWEAERESGLGSPEGSVRQKYGDWIRGRRTSCRGECWLLQLRRGKFWKTGHGEEAEAGARKGLQQTCELCLQYE